MLLARYRLYDDAINIFRRRCESSPDSDDVKFDLADAYFRKGLYDQALRSCPASLVREVNRTTLFLALLGDIHSHLGETARAEEIFRDAIRRNPDNDQYYLSLTLVQLRANNVSGAKETLQKGLARIPGSGKIQWGLGIVSVLEGNTAQAAERLERAVESVTRMAGKLLHSWRVFYYQTGQIDKGSRGA